MILEEKREYILNKLNTEKILRVKDLAKELNCTDASIRYIVNNLSKNKLLKRVHGGVTREDKIVVELDQNIVKTKNIGEKNYITEVALNLVDDNSTIILDSGTTNLLFAQKIIDSKKFKNLNIITNSIKIANFLVNNSNYNVIILGGPIRKLTYTTTNYSENIKTLKANKLFLNIGAVSIKNGLTEPNIQESESKRVLLEIVDEIILLADSSKIDKVALSVVCDFNKIDKLVTDKKVSEDFIKDAKLLGVEVLN